MDYKDGILLVNKPANITSFKVCDNVKKSLKVKKVGHGGTLDPFATGLLILGIGKGTKLLKIISDYEKEYSGTIVLGEKKDSFDITGKTVSVVEKEKLFSITEEKIFKTKEKFSGVLKQTPPQFSALKINGKPLYKYAREGKTVNIPERTVFIEKFEITKINIPEISFLIKCSKGTYIRSIANDFGEILGTFGYLKTLKRISINGYSLENAYNLEEISKEKIIPFDKALNIQSFKIKEEFNHMLENGNIIPVEALQFENYNFSNNEMLYVFGKTCSVICRYSAEKKLVKPEILYKKSLH